MAKLYKYLFFVFVTASLVLGSVSPVQAAALPAEINKQFTPISIEAGAVSVLRVTVFNPNIFELTDVSWSDDLIGVQPGLSIANPAGATTNCVGGSVTAVSGTTSLSLSNATVPAQIGSVPGECYVEVNVTSTTPGNLINTIPTNNLVATGDDNGTTVSITNTSPASATLTVIAVAPPSLTKGFAPNTMFVGQISQLTITINNNDSDTNLTNVSYTDTLPAGVVLASPVSPVVTNCGAYTLNATAGSSTIQLTNGTVTPSQNCIVRVNVTGTSGQYTNTIPAGPGGPGSISTQQGVTNLSPASANLNIQPIGLIKSFSPNSIVAGGSSTLTITLQNPTGSAYTNVGVTDNLPAGLQVSGVPTTTCGGTVTNTVSSVTLTGGTVPASTTPPTPLGTCTITVPVFSPLTTTPATLTNTIPANSITAAQPGVTNFFPATGNITITAPLTGTKAYSPTSIVVGGVSTVTITLTNNSATNLTNVNFTDTLPTNLTVSGTPTSPQCGGGTITNTATSVTLAGGSIPAGASCTIVFDVTSSVAGSGTTYENTIPANNITTAEGVGNSATIRTGTDLTVVNSATLPVTVGKAFQTSPITPGQVTRLRLTITAPVDTSISGISITDTLPTGLVIATPNPPAIPNPTETCPGGTLTAVPGTSTITFTNLPANTLAAGANCTITVYVTSSIPGTYSNIIPANTITTTEGRTNIVDSNTATVVVTSMSMSKAFYPDIIQANGLSTLTITLQNTTDSPLINVSVTDNLPFTNATNGVFVAPVPNASTTCSGGVITAAPGATTITMTGAVVPAQVGGVPGICTISVDVQGRDSTPATSSTRTNTIPTTNVSGTVQSTGTVIRPIAEAQDILTIQPLTIGAVKGFDPVLVYGSATSTMTVELINPNNATLTGIAFTDNMALLASGIVLANPVNFNVGTCGGTLTGNPGDSSFSFSGGTLTPNSTCEITLSVVMQVNGNRTNRIPAGAVTTFNGVSSPDDTEASLTNLPGVSVVKVFNPDVILVGQPTTLTITIENTNSIPVVDMALTDNLPGTLPTGLEIASPNNASTTCGDTTGTPLSLTATAGTQTISLVGAELAANSTCNIIVNVTSSQPGVHINTIPANAITSPDGITNNNSTSSTLTINTSTFSLGNRVWFDTDNSATINGSEVGINGVDVQLYSVDGLGNTTFVATQTTANGGYYRFDNLPAGDYVVVIPATELGAGGTLDGYLSSSTTIATNGTISEAVAPDPDNNTDNDDNGTLQNSGTFNGGVISSTVTLGPSADEPINDADADPTSPAGEAANSQSNRTVDFGFYRTQIGNQIYVDANVNGTFDLGDSNLSGARVRLYSGDGLTEIPVGADGILGTTDDGPNGILTGAGGTYLFSGLPQGNYVIGVTPPAGYASTVDTDNLPDTNNPNTNDNNNDNGVGLNSGQVFSNAVTMAPGSFGALSSNNVTNLDGTTYDPTLDFGFTTLLYSLGNRVWFDTNNNGLIEIGTELGVGGVRVELYVDTNGSGVFDAGDVFQSFATTDTDGYYRFDNLPAGDYVVVIPADNFRDVGVGDTVAGDPLANYWSSLTSINTSGVRSDATDVITNDPDTDEDDSDDNGVTTFTGGNLVNYVSSSAVQLGPGTAEPPGETDLSGTGQGTTDNRANMTVDFGFYQVQIGNLIFADSNLNGTYNSGTDSPLSGATVQLYSSNGTQILVGADGILGTSDDGTTGFTTTGTGLYSFSGLPDGDYIVRVTPPAGAGYTSTIDTFSSPDNADPDVNVDDNDNGIGTGSGTVSSAVLTMDGGEVATNITVNNTTGITNDSSVDFGFVTPLFSLGNRVWFDTDNSSDINGSEVGVNGVAVLLYAADGSGNPTGAILQTESTANGGYYRFDNLPPGNYVVVIPASQFTGAGPLVGSWSSGTSINASGVVSETTAPDPDNDTDNDDNGTRTSLVGFEGAVISAAVTLESTPSEPINDTDADPTSPAGEAVNNQSNRTVDFGFYRQTLGDIVFIDTNSNGVYDSGTDTPLSGAVVRLYSSDGTEIPVGIDGILGTGDDAIGGVTTTGTGTYLFSGLPAGDYLVRVTPPSTSYTSTIDSANSADNADPDGNIDNNDNGIGTGSGIVSSGVFTLTPGSAGADNNNTVTDSSGTTANPTVDFGFLSNPGFAKTIVTTNEPHTTGNDVTIGEIVTYEIVIDLPQGTPFNNVTITDQMDRGLAFVECVSVFVLGVDQTSTVCPPAVTPAVGTSVNPADDGRQVVFTIGNITATAPNQTITIQYRAIVLDVIENQSDVQLNNSVTWAWSGGSQTASAPNVRIIEPDLEIDKSASPTTNVALGTPIQFTLFIDHTTPESQTDAFDVVVTDILPATLEYVPCSAVYSGLVPTTNTATCPAAATNLTFTWDVFPLGQTATITFNARLIGSPAVNTASVAWTSIPIDPQLPSGLPVILSTHNNESTERWYDPLDDVNIYGVSDGVSINSPTNVDDDEDLPSNAPDTGFAPNKITIVPEQPKEKEYTATNVWLEIPSLGLSMPIEGVPLVNGDWDVSWLVQQAGWLQGTAFPSWQGNSVLTSHVVLADGTDGPFAQLDKLTWGDQIIVYAYGTRYVYEVRQNRTVSPSNPTIFQHEEEAWLTLITCKNYNEVTQTYTNRVMVRAVLISTEEENTYFNSEKAR